MKPQDPQASRIQTWRQKAAKGRIYFAQPVNGGPVKIGMTGDVEGRRKQLASWAPWGIEIVATIPGGQMREAALKWALRDYLIQGEWLRSCTAVWRVIVHAETHGDLAWLPMEGDIPSADAFVREAIDFYGSREEAARALGVQPVALPHCKPGRQQVVGHHCTYARFLIEKARVRHELPDFLPRPFTDLAEAA